MKKIFPRTVLFTLLLILLATPQLIFASPLVLVDDANTVVLLHMDGAEGSTMFTDESGKVWAAVGDPHITGSTARFAQSLELGNGRSLLSPDTADVYFAFDDFTIDFWVLFNELPIDNETVTLFSQQQDLNNSISITRSSTTWYFTVKSANIDLVSLSVNKPLSRGVWTHVAVVRDGDTFRMFENGTQLASVMDVDGLPDFAAPLYIGSFVAPLHGNLDEFRISKTARWTANFIPPSAPYAAPTPTPTNTPSATATSITTPAVVVITVPAVITINDTNGNTNTGTNSGGGNGSTSGGSAGSFSALTPIAWPGQGGVAVFGGLTCGGYYIRVRAYVDDNQDKMMSPAEGISGLQVFFLDQTYARLGSTYSVEGKAEFCIPVTHYGKTILIDIPYLQLFGSVQVPEQPNQDLEIWFPGEPPTLPLFLP